MWGGIDFFVALEALMTASIPSDFLPGSSTISPSTHKNDTALHRFPGNPTVRHFIFSEERRQTPMFIYPNATLFLQVLSSSGNRVHLMTPWSMEDTNTILKSSEWVNFLNDARRVALVPGTSEFSFASLGISPEAYTRTVLVVDDAARWSSATALQLIEVRHHSEGAVPYDSMELLCALSRCILFSEWLLRYPSSSIASCAALCSTVLFSYCRFCFQGESVDTNLMLLVSFHGGRVVQSVTEATHVVVLPTPPPQSEPSSSSSSSSSSDSSSISTSDEDEDNSSVTDSTDSSDSSSDAEEDGPPAGNVAAGTTILMDETKTKPNASAQIGGEKTASADVQEARTAALPLSAPAQPSAASSFSPVTPNTANHALSAEQPLSAPSPMLPATVLTVTPSWVYRCIRALRIVPLDTDNNIGRDTDTALQMNEELTKDSKETEAAATNVQAVRKTKLLLCCLLPPPDARPLIWTTFQSIARQNQYDTACFLSISSTISSKADRLRLPTAMSVLEVLTDASLRDVVEVRLLSALPASTRGSGGASASATVRSRGAVVTRASLSTLKISTASSELSRLALSRCERRRDKEAVFAHLQLIASQFLYSYEFVQRRRTQETHCEAGAQTCGPRHASVGVMTDAPGADVVTGEKTLPPSVTGTTTTEIVEATGSVDAAEWRHHLKNVEGKLLSRHEHAHTTLNVAAEAENANARTLSQANETQVPFAEANREDSKAEESNKQLKNEMHNGDTHWNQRAVPLTAVQASLFKPPLLQSSNSIFQSAPPPPISPPLDTVSPTFASARPFHAMPLSSESYTACFIPTSALTREEQDDFFAELRSYPIFSSPELANNVVRLPDGAKCEFASHKAAEDFYRIDYIEFFSRHLPIYPYFEDALDRQEELLSPQPQTNRQPQEMDFPPKHASSSNAAQQLQSLWTGPEAALYAARHGPLRPTLTPLHYVTDVVGDNSPKDIRRSDSVTTVTPCHAHTTSSEAPSPPPPRKQSRAGFTTNSQHSRERRRRLDESNVSETHAYRSTSGVLKEGDDYLRNRRHHHQSRDHSRHSNARLDRHDCSGSHRQDDQRDVRSCYSMGDPPSPHLSHHSSRELHRRRSSTDGRED